MVYEKATPTCELWGEMKPWCLLLCVGCVSGLGGCHSLPKSGSSAPKVVAPAETVLDSESAKNALVEYLEAHPRDFSSPGRIESAEEIRKAMIPKLAQGNITIGSFSVDLDKHTCQLLHIYGQPGTGWWEHWFWQGSFQREANGRWRLEEPKFKKTWGK